jgi:hypothetical protein
LFVVWIRNLACSFAGIIPSQRETCGINQIKSVTVLYIRGKIWNIIEYQQGNKMIQLGRNEHHAGSLH